MILTLSCLTNLCIGSVYAWSVFANPMAMHLSEITGTEITSLAIIFTTANSVGPITMITSQASIIAQSMMQMTVANAALIVSTLALFNTGGRICAGVVSDKIGAIKTIALVFVLLMIGQSCLFFSNTNRVLLFCVGIMIIGFCFGSIMGIYPGFTASKFGSKNNWELSD